MGLLLYYFFLYKNWRKEEELKGTEEGEGGKIGGGGRRGRKKIKRGRSVGRKKRWSTGKQ